MHREGAAYGDLAWLKRQLRRMKKQELAIRFGSAPAVGRQTLVWDSFFSLTEAAGSSARFPMDTLLGMTKAQFAEVADEFFFDVYYVYCQERGLLRTAVYNPLDLAELGLPAHASYAEIRRRFRELAKRHHPDTGGDSSRFVRLLQTYERLISEQR